jgi:hypothetical protein
VPALMKSSLAFSDYIVGGVCKHSKRFI